MQFQVLGPLDVRREGHGESLPLGSFKQRAVLALLVIHRNHVVSTDRIIDALWGEDVGGDRKNSLHVYMSNLRKALEPERSRWGEGSVLLTRAPGYLIRAEPEDVDADRFERMVAEGRALIATDPDSASIVLGEALSLWRGLPFEDFTYESFAQAEIGRLSELRLEAVEARVDADLERGLGRELVSELEGLVREHPLREHMTGHLMLAQYRSGRQAESLRTYQLLKSRLGDELGIEPSAELRKLEERIVLGDESLVRSERGVLTADRSRPTLTVRGYELRERIGSGEVATAYRAFQPGVGREVAVKLIGPELADDPEFIRRFDDEAQLVASLDHPHIVPLYDYWREPGAGYLVMRLMQGGNLAGALAAGPLERRRVARLVAQVGDALDEAHRRGVVHGHLTAENILLDAEGNAALADFGIGAGDGASPASDIRSLAVVVGQAITGRPGDLSEMTVGMDPAAADVLLRAAAQDNGDGYADAAEFSEALAAALEIELDAPGRSEDLPNPYKGLRAFQQVDALDFFGRERLVERLVARLGRPGAQGRFLAAVGPSGSGKSSVVKAGLLPALRRDALPGSAGWYQLEMTPGAFPFEQLEDALVGVAVDPPASLLDSLVAEGGLRRAADRVLPDEHSQLVVVIDQFEELFTLADPATTKQFMAAIVDAVNHDHSRVRVIVTLRADYYDRPLANRRFGELLRNGTEIVTSMSPEELERAITGPAERVGVQVSPSVVAEMIGEVADRVGALPLLQYALTELFSHRRGATITLESYRAIGGVAGALGDRAEGLFSDLESETQSAAHQMFLRLVAVGDHGEMSRRRVLLSELTALGGDSRHMAAAVDIFGRRRFLSFDRDPISRGPTVEISHEALISEWPRLEHWIQVGRSDIQAQRRLAIAAAEWAERNENLDFLFTGARLARYESWLGASPVHLTGDERRFLEAGIAARRRSEAETQERARKEAQFRRRSRLAAGLAVVVALVVSLGGLAEWQRRRAADLAVDLALAERVRVLTGESRLRLQADSGLAAMLAVEAARADADDGMIVPEVIDSLHDAIQVARTQYPVDSGAEVAVRLLSGGPTGVFMMPPDDLIALAQSLVARTFTDSECVEFFATGFCPDPRTPLPTNLTMAGSYAGTPGAAPLAGTSVTVSGNFVNDEADALRADLAAISEATGIEISYEPTTRGALAIDEVRAGRADIVLIPQPAAVADLASEGHLMDLSAFIDRGTLRDSFGEYLVGLVSVTADGKWPSDSGDVYGVWTRVSNKSLIWHASPEFEQAGYAVPRSWADLIALSDRLVDDGATPWCLGIGDPSAEGWLATDWIETIVLRTQGPEFYDRWWRHEVPFDDPAVVEAARRAGELAFTDGYVSPGPAAIVDRMFWEAAFLLGDKPTSCWLLPFGSVAPSFAGEFGGSMGVFDFPVIDPRFADTVVGGGDIAVAVADRPEVRVVMGAIASPEFGAEWAKIGIPHIAPHREFDLDNYPDPGVRRIAEITLRALEEGGFRFDASDLMPPDVGAGTFWSGMAEYFRQGPDSLEQIMANIEASWPALEDGS